MTISLPQIQLFLLALTRVLAVFANIPIFGGSAIPLQIRALLGLVITLVLFPANVSAPAQEPIALGIFAMMIGQELIIGLIAGFASTLTFAAIQIAGEMIGFSTGFNSGRVLNPAFGESSSSIDQLFVMLALLFFMVTNGHHMVILAISRTFNVIPLTTSLSQMPIETIFSTVSKLITAGIQLSLPAVGSLIMADITLGLLAKVAPQIQVFFLGIPMKIALGLLAVTITLSIYHQTIIDLLHNIGDRMILLLGA